MTNDSERPDPLGRDGIPTRRHLEILKAIQDHVAAHGCTPTNRDIASAAGLRSPSTANYHLRQLKAAGFVSYDARSRRTVRVLEPGLRALRAAGEAGETPRHAGPEAGYARREAGYAGPDAGQRPGREDPLKVVWVPVVGQIAAGQPIPPLESIEERFPLPKDVTGPEEGLFILEVVGDSMIGVGIFPGDWVIVRQLLDEPKNGDIVAALLDGIEVEGTVKTYRKVDPHVWLMPQNPAHTPILGDDAIISGKVIAVLRRV